MELIARESVKKSSTQLQRTAKKRRRREDSTHMLTIKTSNGCSAHKPFGKEIVKLKLKHKQYACADDRLLERCFVFLLLSFYCCYFYFFTIIYVVGVFVHILPSPNHYCDRASSSLFCNIRFTSHHHSSYRQRAHVNVIFLHGAHTHAWLLTAFKSKHNSIPFHRI